MSPSLAKVDDVDHLPQKTARPGTDGGPCGEPARSRLSDTTTVIRGLPFVSALGATPAMGLSGSLDPWLSSSSRGGAPGWPHGFGKGENAPSPRATPHGVPAHQSGR
jgi:hypothetical protein